MGILEHALYSQGITKPTKPTKPSRFCSGDIEHSFVIVRNSGKFDGVATWRCRKCNHIVKSS